MPLFWRVYLAAAGVLVLGALALVLLPVTVSERALPAEIAVLAAGLALLLAVTVVLVRRSLAPLDRLVALARGVDLLRPGQRLAPGEGGDVREVAEVVEAFNGMLDRLEAERAESARRTLSAQSTMLSRAEGVEFVVDLTDVRAAQNAARAERAVREEREREFVANAAHELRTPLTAIIGAVQALQAGAARIPEERDRFLDHLGREAARLSRLSDSLLVLVQIDGTRGVPRAPVPLEEVLRDVAADLAVAPGVRLRVDAEPGVEAVANRGLVQRVVANFAENAAKHTAAGHIGLTARGEGDDVLVEVRDTGSGLGAGTAERAFDRFYRGGERSADGFGLGLAIARQAAAAMGGSIALSDAPGGGTLARLVLPGR